MRIPGLVSQHDAIRSLVCHATPRRHSGLQSGRGKKSHDTLLLHCLDWLRGLWPREPIGQQFDLWPPRRWCLGLVDSKFRNRNVRMSMVFLVIRVDTCVKGGLRLVEGVVIVSHFDAESDA
jgi:hypothetical protein